jgi:hypothetical protein
MISIPLSAPIKVGDNEITKLTLDLDSLTGNSLIAAEKEARMRGDTSVKPLLSMEGLAILAAKLAGVKPEDIMGLKAPDFLLVTETVSNFLFSWVLPSLTVPESSGN